MDDSSGGGNQARSEFSVRRSGRPSTEASSFPSGSLSAWEVEALAIGRPRRKPRARKTQAQLRALWKVPLIVEYLKVKHPLKLAASDPLPSDPATLKGLLPNGLEYYIHSGPSYDDAEIRLVVKAGSTSEGRGKCSGVAHLVEHLAFRETESFPDGELVRYLERNIGITHGLHLNAYTSYNETVYHLKTRSDAVGDAIFALSEMALRVVFRSEIVESEKMVLMEELRVNGAHGLITTVMEGTVYAHHSPSGYANTIPHLSADMARAFYNAFYRPDNMALIVVGNVDVEAAVKAVNQRFASFKAPITPLITPFEKTFVLRSFKSRVGAHVDLVAEVCFYFRTQPLATTNTGGLACEVAAKLVTMVFRGRMNKHLLLDADAPLLSCVWERIPVAKHADISSIRGKVRGARTKQALIFLIRQLRQMSHIGEMELEVAKQAYLNELKELPKESSTERATKLTQLVLRGHPNMPDDYRQRMMRQLVKNSNVEDVNRIAARVIPIAGWKTNMVCAAVWPTGYAATEDCYSVFERCMGETLERTEDLAMGTPKDLLPILPFPGTVTRRTKSTSLGAIEFELSNGMRVICRKGPGFDLCARASGGLDLFEDTAAMSTLLANDAADKFGRPGLPRDDIHVVLASTALDISTLLTAKTTVVQVKSASPLDIELGMQILFLAFTSHTYSGDFEAARSQELQSLESDVNNSTQRVFERMLRIGARRPSQLEMLDSVRAAITGSSFEIGKCCRKHLFSDPSAFTVVIQANCPIEVLETMSERYLASIPSTRVDPRVHTVLRPRCLAVAEGFPPSPVSEVLVSHGMLANLRVASVAFATPVTLETPTEIVVFLALKNIIVTRAMDILRTRLGAVYTPYVGIVRSGLENGALKLIFEVRCVCDPRRVDEVMDAILSMLENLRKEGFSDEEVAVARASARTTHTLNENKVSYWRDMLSQFSLESSEEQHHVFESALTAEAFSSLVNREFSLKRFVAVGFVSKDYMDKRYYKQNRMYAFAAAGVVVCAAGAYIAWRASKRSSSD